MNFVEDFPARVSFGTDIRKPALLETRSTGYLLEGVAAGRWSDAVRHVRQFPTGSPDFKKAKERLPYFTPSGSFNRRGNAGLLEHSGQVAVDVDDLADEGRVRCLHRAVDDPYVLAFFESVSGRGVRLLFRTEPLNQWQHTEAFRQIAAHVCNGYKVTPDLSGSDVSRACFVSFDGNLLAKPHAECFPLRLRKDSLGLDTWINPCVQSEATVIARETLGSLWNLGELHAAHELKADGCAYTHLPIRDLARKLALRCDRDGLRLGDDQLRVAFDGWCAGAAANGVRLRASPDEYLGELKTAVKSVRQTPRFRKVADIWLRWKKAKGFPKRGSHGEKLVFAIDGHCRETKSSRFFLGARDAATIIEAGRTTASTELGKLVRAKRLKRLPASKNPRHAAEFQLIEGGAK